MPSRIIREGILESERVDQLSLRAEVFYRRGMSKVDDHGRFYAKPELLIAALYPLRIGKVRVGEIVAWLGECVDARLVRVYTVDGKEYLEYLDFGQQVRSKSKFPAPPGGQSLDTCEASAQQPLANAQQLRSMRDADAHLVVSEFVSVSGAERDALAPAGLALVAPGRASRLESEYSPEFNRAWAAYPERDGGSSKRAAWKAWKARLAAGADCAAMIAGVERYAAYITRTGKRGTQYVKRAETFFGPDEHFRAPWTEPNAEGAGARHAATLMSGAVL